MNKSIINVVALLVLLCVVQTVVSDDKIFGGEYADEGQFPFMVELAIDGAFICGGSLIGPYHVVTAAHCTGLVTTEALQIWAGSVDHSLDQGVFINVAAIYNHPDYNSDTLKNDIAVIKLKTPFPKATGVRTISLASILVNTGVEVTFAGWGKTKYDNYPYLLRYASAPVITTTKCRSYNDYGDVSGTSQICAFESGQDPCEQDSGGPMFTGTGAAATQHGVVSYGVGCGIKPEVYASISYYRSWILSKAVHTVSTTCNGCTTNTAWKNMCESMGGTHRKTSVSYQCQNLNPFKTRKINTSWVGCSDALLKNFCEKVGRYSCVGGNGKCTPL